MDSKKRKESASQEVKKAPVQTLRFGDLSAAIWSREATVNGEIRVFYSVTLERSYKDRDGSYRYSRTFDRDSLQPLADLCIQATQVIDKLREKEA